VRGRQKIHLIRGDECVDKKYRGCVRSRFLFFDFQVRVNPQKGKFMGLTMGLPFLFQIEQNSKVA